MSSRSKTHTLSFSLFKSHRRKELFDRDHPFVCRRHLQVVEGQEGSPRTLSTLCQSCSRSFLRSDRGSIIGPLLPNLVDQPCSSTRNIPTFPRPTNCLSKYSSASIVLSTPLSTSISSTVLLRISEADKVHWEPKKMPTAVASAIAPQIPQMMSQHEISPKSTYPALAPSGHSPASNPERRTPSTNTATATAGSEGASQQKPSPEGKRTSPQS